MKTESKYNKELADSVLSNGLIIRGTDEWNQRELKRELNGASVLSYGVIPKED